jgi:hypothetical protein
MSGHIDDAEHCLDEPIVSFSVGCPAVFLIGGRSKSEAPTGILLRSGDALVMSGASRTCYHGVPLIMKHGSCGGLTWGTKHAEKDNGGDGDDDDDDSEQWSAQELKPATARRESGSECESTAVDSPAPVTTHRLPLPSGNGDSGECATSVCLHPGEEAESGTSSRSCRKEMWCCDMCRLSSDILLSTITGSDDEAPLNGHVALLSLSPSGTATDTLQRRQQEVALHYLNQARINLNSRRVTSVCGEWVVKNGTGAMPLQQHTK